MTGPVQKTIGYDFVVHSLTESAARSMEPDNRGSFFSGGRVEITIGPGAGGVRAQAGPPSGPGRLHELAAEAVRRVCLEAAQTSPFPLPDCVTLEVHLPLLTRKRLRMGGIGPEATGISLRGSQILMGLRGEESPEVHQAFALVSQPGHCGASLRFSHRRGLKGAADAERMLSDCGLAGISDRLIDAEVCLSLPVDALRAWRTAPRPATADHRLAFRRVSLAVQRALRTWLAYDQSGREGEPSAFLAAYSASRLFRGRLAGEYAYDVLNQKAVGPLHGQVPRGEIRQFNNLLMADGHVMDSLVLLGQEARNGVRPFHRLGVEWLDYVNLKLRRLYKQQNYSSLATLLLIVATAAVAQEAVETMLYAAERNGGEIARRSRLVEAWEDGNEEKAA